MAERLRKKGVADGLMKEFFNRVRAAGATTVTTGSSAPEYFYALRLQDREAVRRPGEGALETRL